MKQLNIMNLQLYKYHLEITSMKGTVNELFNRSKISEFYKGNSLRINSLLRALNDIRLKYFELDENGNTKIGEDNQPVLKEGFTQEDYEKAHTELMRTKTILVL
jgi:hypothetical protein